MASYVLQLYVGSISDVELTRVSGYLDTLEGVSVMADHGFTVRDLLADQGIALNIPPFLDGKSYLEGGGQSMAFPHLKLLTIKKCLLVYVVSEATRTVSEVVNFKIFLGECAPRPPYFE